MSARLVAAALATSLLVTACGPVVLFSTDDHPYYQESSHDDTGTVLLVGSVVMVGILAMLAMTRSSDDSGSKKAAPIATRAAEPRTMYYAPMPSTDDEAEQLRLQRMYVQGQVLGRAGRCDGVRVIARALWRDDPAYYQVFAADIAIAPCLVDKLSTGN